MQLFSRWIVASALAAVCLSCAAAQGAEEVSSPLDFKMKTIDGQDQDLSEFKGRVVLIVNVASECGLTPQYEGLEKVYEEYKDDGFVILGFPANEFGKQEPGTDDEIAEFCESNYGVKFPMFSKIVVKGEGQHPLYQHLTSKDTGGKFAGDIKWNFEKFLIGRDGQVVARFEPKTTPESAEVVAAIQAQLKESKP